MKNNSVHLDMNTLKVLAPIAIGIGAALGVFLAIGLWSILGGLWSLLLLAAWVVSGGLYANSLLSKRRSVDYTVLAINGAALAGLTEVSFDVVSGVILSLEEGSFASFFSLSLFLEAAIMGAIAAVAWYAYKTGAHQSGS